MPKEYLKTLKTKSMAGWGRDVPLFEDFESANINWRQITYGGATISLDATKVFRGNKSLKLLLGTGASSYAGVEKHFNKVNEDIGKFSLFLAGQNVISTANLLIYLYLPTIDAETQLTPTLKINFGATGYISLYLSEDTGLSWKTIATNLMWPLSSNDWAPLILYFNLKTQKYMKLIFCQKIYDVSNYRLGNQIPNLAHGSIITLRLEERGSPTADSIWVDDVLIEI